MPSPKTTPAHPAETKPARHLVDEQRAKAEQAEVAGRHKNDGQKDHKGARSVPHNPR